MQKVLEGEEEKKTLWQNKISISSSFTSKVALMLLSLLTHSNEKKYLEGFKLTNKESQKYFKQ